MGQDRWQQVRALFDRLADLPAEQWRPRLSEACDGDIELEQEVLALLEADADTAFKPRDMLARQLSGLAGGGENEAEQGLAGTRLGPFRLLRRIGRGGMGAVWLAERADGQYAQQVAIKLVRSSWDSAELHARFRSERQMLADLHHPHIASLIDGGVTDDGKPWLALEYVDGTDLCRYAEQQRLDLRQRVQLFLTACAAVSHAHARLIVHRDLKPSNILVRRDGVVKLLDFGIAKLIDAPAAQATAVRTFTPEYAAPEQIRGEPVTTAIDVYTLGLLLYELLTGRRPYVLDHTTPSAYERAVLEQTPTRPSQAVTRDDESGTAAAKAAQRRLTPKTLKRELRGDLDAIVLKALRKEPEQRYASVQDMAGDLRAWLQHRPVAARRGGWHYATVRFLQRHALAAGMALVAVLALCGGLGVALWQAQQAHLQRDMALAESAKSRAVLEFMGGLFELADPDKARGAQVTARELLARGAERIRGRFAQQPDVRAELLGAMANAQEGLGLYAEALPMAEEAAQLTRGLDKPALQRSAELDRARILHRLGRYRDALALLEPLRSGAAPGDRAAQALLADVEYQRASALQALNRFEDADRAYAQAYREQRRLFGTTDRRTQATAMRHVSLLMLRGQYEPAERLARETLAAVRSSASRTDPHLAEAVDTLAMILSNTGPLSEAEALRREEIAIRTAAQGAEHPDTIGAINDLGSVQFAQRRFAQAVENFRRVLAHRRAQFGTAHPSVALVANNLASCELELDHPHTARPLAEEALRIRMAHYGPKHHGTAASLLTLGAIELELGEFDAGERHLRQALDTYDATLGPDSKFTLPALRELARAEVLSGRVDPACKTAERAYALARTGDPDPAKRAYVSAIRAACRIASHGAADAKATLASDLALLRREQGDNDRRTRKIASLADVVASK